MHGMRAGVNITDLGQFNSQVVFHTLRHMGTGSQTEIAEQSGLSLQTVSALVRQLTQAGFIKEVGTQSIGRGRPRTLLEIDVNARFALGILVDPTRITMTYLNFAGDILEVRTRDDVDPDDGPGTIARLSQTVSSLLAEAEAAPDRLAGIGMAVPGPIDNKSQSMAETLWLPGWADYAPGQDLATRLSLPRVPMVKDTLAAVTGENWVRVQDLSDSTMVYVYIGTGTGIGLSHQGDALAGSSGNAGEVGRALVALGREGGEPGRGIENDPAVLVARAVEAGILAGPPPSPQNLAKVESMFRDLCQQAQHGHGTAAQLLSTAGQRIAGLAVLATELVDADAVVLGGPFWDLVEPWYFPAVQESFARPSARGPHSVTISSSQLGAYVAAMGAGAVVLDSLFVPRAPVNTAVEWASKE